MKRVIAAIMILVMALSMSGCKISYWDGLSKSEAKELVLNMLEEKYGEEFVVKRLYTRGGTGYNTPSNLIAYCSLKSDENIVFETEVNTTGKKENKKRYLYDNYIQNVVRKQLKQDIDCVLKKNYDTFATEVFVTSLKPFYDSGLRSARDATIKVFSETFSIYECSDEDVNRTCIWIVLESSDTVDIEKLKKVVKEMTPFFYSLYVIVEVFHAEQEIVDLCNEKVNELTPDHYQVMEVTCENDLRRDLFIYDINKNGLAYVGNNLD